MKVSEFKAFIEGLDLAAKGNEPWSPNPMQWKAIKDRINQLDGAEVKRVEWPEWQTPVHPTIGDFPNTIYSYKDDAQ